MGEYRKIKNSKITNPSSLEDIKDGLLKMILFTNLEDVKADGEKYKPIAVLKLTVENHLNENQLSSSQKEILKLLRAEAKVNKFQIVLK